MFNSFGKYLSQSSWLQNKNYFFSPVSAEEEYRKRAIAKITGDNNIHGTAEFLELESGKTRIKVEIHGLSAGKHGIHVKGPSKDQKTRTQNLTIVSPILYFST